MAVFGTTILLKGTIFEFWLDEIVLTLDLKLPVSESYLKNCEFVFDLEFSLFLLLFSTFFSEFSDAIFCLEGPVFRLFFVSSLLFSFFSFLSLSEDSL